MELKRRAMRDLYELLRGKGRRSIDWTREAVAYDGAFLAPHELRFCGEEFQDDAYYIKSARLEAQRLVRYCQLGLSSRVLDVGCATGRLAIGILAEVGEIAAYHGLDVDRPSIEWCTRHIRGHHPTFHFIHFDVKNARYNPEGCRSANGLRLPLAGASIDIINLYSVFSHLSYGDVVAYLTDFRRVITSAGHLFLTVFVEDDVPNFQINPPGYRVGWSGPLHCVRFERQFFETMLGESGFRVDHFEHGRESNGQSAYYLSPMV